MVFLGVQRHTGVSGACPGPNSLTDELSNKLKHFFQLMDFVKNKYHELLNFNEFYKMIDEFLYWYVLIYRNTINQSITTKIHLLINT